MRPDVRSGLLMGEEHAPLHSVQTGYKNVPPRPPEPRSGRGWQKWLPFIKCGHQLIPVKLETVKLENELIEEVTGNGD
ncbi:MAG: hypothetical protein Kow0069_36300 [Promethearchaeota archaeon]